MVVIAIVMLLLALIASAVQRVREAANRALCQENLHQVAIALHNQAGDREKERGIGAVSWMVQLLPYIEQDPLFAQSLAALRADPFTYHDPPHVGAHTVIRLYCCPSDSRLTEAHVDPDGFLTAFSTYMGIGGANAAVDGDGFFGRVGLRLGDVHDGLSNTIMIAERPPPDNWLAGRWYSSFSDTQWTYFRYRGPDQVMWAYYPASWSFAADCSGPFRFGPGRTNNPCDRWHFWSLHSGGANFAFCDGSVRFLPYAAEPFIVPLATCNGGEVVDLSQFE
jgi:prepilin-type processing-associated H-X9-DG protein